MNTTRIQHLAATGDADAQVILDRNAARHGALNTLDRVVDVVLAAIEAEDEDMLAPVYEALNLDDWQRTTLAALLTVDDLRNWPLGELDEDSDEEDAETARAETREQVAEIVEPWFCGKVFSQTAVDEIAEELEGAGWDARWYEQGQAMPYWRLTSPGGGLTVSVWWDDSQGRELVGWCWSQEPSGAEYNELGGELDSLNALRALLDEGGDEEAAFTRDAACDVLDGLGLTQRSHAVFRDELRDHAGQYVVEVDGSIRIWCAGGRAVSLYFDTQDIPGWVLDGDPVDTLDELRDGVRALLPGDS